MSSPLLAALQKKQGELSKVEILEDLEIHPLRFDEKQNQWTQVSTTLKNTETKQSNSPFKKLTLFTMNIFCKTHDLEVRMKGLVDLISHHDPEIVCIQENTDDHQNHLLQHPHIRKHYYVSNFQGQEKGFKVSLYSKIPPSKLFLHATLASGRPAIIGHFTFSDNTTMAIACVHLLNGKSMSLSRCNQLEFVIDRIKYADLSIIAGDYNMEGQSNPEEEGVMEKNEYKDIWTIVHPKDRGLTRGPHRLDRVVMRDGKSVWNPEKIAVIGDSPIAKNVFISDHFGLVTSIKHK